MCGRYSLAGPNPAEVRERFALGGDVEVRRRWNVAPQDDVLAVTTTKEGVPRGELLRWGLVPFWAKDPSVGYKTINARAETVAEKPAYRDAFRSRRCLVVADGFYEWKAPERPKARKRPFHITRDDGAPFAFAGLWSTWRGPDDLVLRTCTIVTTNANDLIADVHDRMPVILPPEAEAVWLGHDTPASVLHELLAPFPASRTGRREVGTAVNDARHDAPDCLDPPDPDAPTGDGQTTLFG